VDRVEYRRLADAGGCSLRGRGPGGGVGWGERGEIRQRREESVCTTRG